MSVQPTGTVTFLFTDVEDHSRLWIEHPGEMSRSLERHDQILRSVTGRWGGYVFATAGDGFSVAFARVEAAVRAAIELQQELRRETWPSECELRVRMALHTGEAEERGGDYFGPAVIRAARLMSVGHGGQVLLSAVTARLVEERSEYAVMLRPLGEVTLRGLGRPERVLELRYPGLDEEFPALNVASMKAGSLPHVADELIGRDLALADAASTLSDGRLVTLVGPGGVGKTRVAIEIGEQFGERFGDGVWFVPLASVSDGSAIPNAVAEVLGVHESAGRSLTETIVEAIAGRELLLILDNCEHVMDGARKLARAVTENHGSVSLLATSREPLAVRGERVLPVEPLPTDGRADSVMSPAVELFVRRAMAADRSFAADAAAVGVAREICVRLDGVPLAIELAASRVRGLGLDGLLGHLDDRFRLLRDRAIADPRHQSLDATVAWSFELLAPRQREVFCRASVFASGFTLDGAEQVLAFGALDALDVADGLAELVDKSMLQAFDASSGRRYRMLESMRQYGSDVIDPSTRAAVERRLIDYYVAWAERADHALRGADPKPWFAAIAAEFDNLREAVRLAMTAGDVDSASRLVVALHTFSRSYAVSEPRSWAADLIEHLELDRPLDGDVVAVAIGGARSGRGSASTSELLARIDRAETAGLLEPSAFCDHEVGIALWFRGRTDDSIARHERALAKARASDDRALEAWILSTLSMAQDATARDRAIISARHAIDVARASQHPIGVAMGLMSLAGAVIHDTPAEAIPIIDEVITLAERTDMRWAYASGLRLRAHALSRSGRLREASAAYISAVELNGVGDFGELLWYTVINILEHLQRIDRPETAALAIGKISTARGASRDALIQRSLERSRHALDKRLGERRRDEIEVHGQALTLSEFLNRIDHDLRQHANERT